MMEPIAARAAASLHIPRERILFNASHTHSAPLAGDYSVYAVIMGPYLEAQKKVIARYTERLSGLIYDAIAQAVGASAAGDGRVRAGLCRIRRQPQARRPS